MSFKIVSEYGIELNFMWIGNENELGHIIVHITHPKDRNVSKIMICNEGFDEKSKIISCGYKDFEIRCNNWFKSFNEYVKDLFKNHDSIFINALNNNIGIKYLKFTKWFYYWIEKMWSFVGGILFYTILIWVGINSFGSAISFSLFLLFSFFMIVIPVYIYLRLS